MDKTLRPGVICALVLLLVASIGISAPVYAQTTADTASTQKWCESKTDELKDRVTDLMLLTFKKDITYNMTVALINTGNILVAEIDEKIQDCPEFITGSDLQTLQQMHDAAVFFTGIGDIVNTMFTDPGANITQLLHDVLVSGFR